MTNPIVGIGELLWDIYPDGRKVAGGAPFNFAFHCHRLGHPAAIVSRVGDDDLGRELRAEVRRLGLSDEFIQTDPDHPTGTVNVTLDAAGVPTYTIAENMAWDHIAWADSLARLATAGTAAVCHGTLALRSPATKRTLKRLITESVRPKPEPSVLYVLDVNLRHPRPNPAEYHEALCGAEWVKVNGEEFAEIAAAYELPPSELPQFQFQHSSHDGTVWLVTDGPRGVRIVTRGPHPSNPYPFATLGLSHGDEFTEPAAPARAIDTVGAGDSFTAAMVCLHLEGRSLRECARFASHYAARVCEYPGATPLIDRTEVERAAFGA